MMEEPNDENEPLSEDEYDQFGRPYEDDSAW